MASLTEFLTNRSLNPKDYQVVIEALEDQCEWSGGTTMHWDEWVDDVEKRGDLILVLFSRRSWNKSGRGGISRGWELEVFDQSGQRTKLQGGLYEEHKIASALKVVPEEVRSRLISGLQQKSLNSKEG
jgi:hypothetical protein